MLERWLLAAAGNWVEAFQLVELLFVSAKYVYWLLFLECGKRMGGAVRNLFHLDATDVGG